MERRPKRSVDNNKSYISWIIWIFVIVGIITFIISYTMYGNNMDERIGSQGMGEESADNNGMLNIMTNEEVTKVNLSIGKTVNEVENSTEESQENDSEKTEKIAVNTSEIENKVVSQRKESNEEESATTIVEEIVFIKPVDGEIIKNYSKDNLVYSSTLEEWTTHLGIDYAAEKTSIVKAAADGKIKSIKNDPRYGLTIMIEHSNGFTSMYSNLLSTEFVSVGEEVKAGQTIGTVGNTATFEIADETHLHFEIMKDGESVDPNMYIK